MQSKNGHHPRKKSVSNIKVIKTKSITKDQLISKCPFGVKTSSKKTFSRISALASEKRSIQKNKGTLLY